MSQNENSHQLHAYSQTYLRTTKDRLRVWFVATAAFLFSFLGVLSHTPVIGTIANYSAIVSGFIFALIYVVANFHNTRIKHVDLLVVSALLLAVPIALMQGQGLMDILGNFVRACFLIFALMFWRVRSINIEKLVQDLYKAFWFVAIFMTLVIFAMQAGGLPMSKDNHLPVLIFLFAIALYRKGTLSILALLAMAIIAGKSATFIAFLVMALVYILRKGLLTLSTLSIIFLLVYIFVPSNQIIVISHAVGGNFAELSEALVHYTTGTIDPRLLNAISSNRFQEYLSVLQDWEDNGIPVLGRGLGATVFVELGWLNILVERSTLHNSFLVIFHTTGIFGIIFVLYYILAPTKMIQKRSPELFLVMVGCIVYSLFSNVLLQAPSTVFIVALAKRISEQGRSFTIAKS